jgi:hypothetical protein
MNAVNKLGKVMNSYKELSNTLDLLNFSDFYINEISSKSCKVDLGKRKGIIQFTSIKSAADLYTYESSGKYKIDINKHLDTLNTPECINDDELILQCIEIFDWGGVQKSNIINSINLHREKALKPYLLQCKEWFEDDTTLKLDINNLIWSSGWTKVFSFMFNMTTIYDSRVAAYINYIFAQFYSSLSNETDRQALKIILQTLVSFKGTATRVRCLKKLDREVLGVKMKGGNDKNNFIANKVASWLLRYICELEYKTQSQANFRQIDKAMFMLGFDIYQVDKNANFE